MIAREREEQLVLKMMESVTLEESMRDEDLPERADEVMGEDAV